MKQRFAGDSALMAVATIVASAANYATNVWLARSLDIDAFGDAALIVSALLLFSAAAVAVRLAASHKRTAGELAQLVALRRRVAIWGAAFGLVGVAAAIPLARALNSTSVSSFVILGISIPIFLSMSVDRGIMQGEQRFTDLSTSMIVEAVVRLVATALSLLVLPGATSAAAGMAISFGAARAHAAIQARRHVVPTTTILAGASNAAVGLPLVLLLCGQVLISNGDVIVMSAMAPALAGSFAGVALIGRLSFPLSWAIINVAFPKLSDLTQRSRAARSAARMVTSVAVITIAGTWIFGPIASSSLFGADANTVTPWLIPYAIATGAFAIATLGAVIDVAVGRVRGAVWLLVFGGIQTLLLAIVAPLGIGPAVWAQVLAMGCAALVALVQHLPELGPGRGSRRDRAVGDTLTAIEV